MAVICCRRCWAGRWPSAASGYGEFFDQVEAGEVRVLADQRAGAGRRASMRPTLKESGIDLEFTNWRGVVAPPELSDADKQALVGAVAKMHESQEWKDGAGEERLDRRLSAGG